MTLKPDLFALDAEGRLWLGFYPSEEPITLQGKARVRWKAVDHIRFYDLPSPAAWRILRAHYGGIKGTIIPTNPSSRAPQFEYLDDL